MLALPALIPLNAFGGDWERYLKAIYDQFCKDFIHSKPFVPNRRVGLKKHPLEKGKEATFWHFVSTGETEIEREICIRRCERIAWIRPMIEYYDAPNIHWWIEFKSVKSALMYNNVAMATIKVAKGMTVSSIIHNALLQNLESLRASRKDL